jgi:hypothetical protein
VAEEEIRLAEQRHPAARLALRAALPNLVPDLQVLFASESVYRARARALLDAVASGSVGIS